MKAKVLSLALAAAMAVGGCQIAGKNAPQPGTVEFNQAVQNNSNTIKIGASIATTTVLLSIKEKDREQFGIYAAQISDSIHTALVGDKLDLNGVRSLAAELISKDGGAYKLQLGALLSAISNVVDSKSKNFADIPAESRTLAVRSFLLAATEGVQEATLLYRPPTTQPVVSTN